MKTILVLSVFMVITSVATTVSAQTSQKTDPSTGNVTTTWSSDKYGPGGKQETTSDEKGRLVSDCYKDKCGRVREIARYWKDGTVTCYYDENGKAAVKVVHKPHGDGYFSPKGKDFNPWPEQETDQRMDPREGKALVAKLEKTPSAPCPEKTAGEAGSPEKKPQPKGKPEIPSGGISPSLIPETTPFTPSTFNWTGFYLGVLGGYTRTSSDFDLILRGLWNDFPNERDEVMFRGRHEFDENGFGLGGYAGYNYQCSRGLVFGAEIAGRNLWGPCDSFDTGDFAVPGGRTFDVRSTFRTTYLVTVGPRFGYACSCRRFLYYLSGGLAFGELDVSQKIFTNNVLAHEDGRGSDTQFGWSVGGGVQYAITNNLSVRAEYQHADLGSLRFPSKGSDQFRGFAGWHSTSLLNDGVNFGVEYKIP